jgi:hypothetical protein
MYTKQYMKQQHQSHTIYTYLCNTHELHHGGVNQNLHDSNTLESVWWSMLRVKHLEVLLHENIVKYRKWSLGPDPHKNSRYAFDHVDFPQINSIHIRCIN